MDYSQVYFYPHGSLRDRQLDTIRRWPKALVVNPEILTRISPAQVPESKAKRGRIDVAWKQRIPLINMKFRPKGIANDTVVYAWGAVIASGPFIVDLDNPYALVGYNLKAMPLWRPVLRHILLSERCIQIRCMSNACRKSLLELFGEAVAEKAMVKYPKIEQQVKSLNAVSADGPRFLFVGTQFEIKGGAPLLQAWRQAMKHLPPSAHLSIITHLPARYEKEVATLNGASVHEASYKREQIWSEFFKHCDVLVLPTLVESFGMVALEALAHGMALIVTDVYALPELVDDNKNGRIVKAPISIWDGMMPAPLHYRLAEAASIIRNMDMSTFIDNLVEVILDVGENQERLLSMRQASVELFQERFSEKSE